MLISWLTRLYSEDDGAPTGGTQGDPPAPPPAAQEPVDDFEKDRAMATIKSLRAFEKEAKAKLKRLEELETQAAAQAEAEMTAAQKAEKRASELEAKYKEAEALLKRVTLKDAAQEASQKASLTFASGALSDAIALGIFDTLEWTDDGKPKGMTQAVKELAQSKPYLFAKATAPADIGATDKGKESKEPDPRRLAQRFGIRTG